MGEVGDVLSGKARGRVSKTDKIFSINMGIALEDVSVAQRIYLAARAQGKGISLPL